MKKKELRPKDFKIEKGVPVPRNVTGRPRIYPFDELKVGESFFVKGGTPEAFNGSRAQAQKRTGCTFTIRAVEGGVRVWRIK